MDADTACTVAFLAKTSGRFVGETRQDAISVAVVAQGRWQNVGVAQTPAGRGEVFILTPVEEAVPTLAYFFAFPDGTQCGKRSGTKLADGGNAERVQTAQHARSDTGKIRQLQGV